MNRLQNTELFLMLACLGTGVFAGLLPGGGSSGYQYNRPGIGSNNYRENVRPSTSYGVPGFGGTGNGGFGGGFAGQVAGAGFSGGGFAGQGGFGGFAGNGGGYQGGNGNRNGGYNYNDENNRPRPYSFQYEVRDPPSGNDYGQQESSDGNTVRGEYRVLLPDSRTQIVRYTADDANGYNADVQYEGQAQFPQNVGGYNGNGVGYRGSGGGGNGFGNNGVPNNQYLPAGVDYGK